MDSFCKAVIVGYKCRSRRLQRSRQIAAQLEPLGIEITNYKNAARKDIGHEYWELCMSVALGSSQILLKMCRGVHGAAVRDGFLLAE
jgi:hypothetical protein